MAMQINNLTELLTEAALWHLEGEGVTFTLHTAKGPKTIVFRAERPGGRRLASGAGEGHEDLLFRAEQPESLVRAGEGEVPNTASIIGHFDSIDLGDLTALVQLLPGAEFFVPPQIPLGSLLALRTVTMVIEWAPFRMSSLLIEVETTKPWELIDGDFTLKTVLLSFSIPYPLEAGFQIFCEAASTLDVGSTLPLEARAAVPALTFSVDLPQDVDEAPLKPLLARVFPDGPLTDLTLTKLHAEMSPREQSYAFALAVKQDWQVIPGVLSLDGMGLEIDRAGAARPTGKLTGFFTLGGFPLYASAARTQGASPAASNWHFTAGTYQTVTFTDEGDEVWEDVKVPVGALVSDLIRKVGIPMPTFLDNLVFTNITAEFDSTEKDLSVRARWQETGLLAVDSYAARPSPRRDKTLVVSFTNAGHENASLKKMIESVSPDLGSIIPDGLTVDLRTAIYASWEPAAGPRKSLFGVDVGGGLDLSKLPLVGPSFEGHSVKLNYTILAPSGVITKAEVESLAANFTRQGATLAPQEFTKKALALRGTLEIGDLKVDLSPPVHVNPASGQIEPTPGSRDGSEMALWFSLQKTLGPVRLERVGVKFDAGEVSLMLDASLSLGPLSLALMGLTVTSPITPLVPSFHLDGLALDYRTKALTIGGAFLRREVEVNGKKTTTYDGLAVLETKLAGRSVSLSAIGGYADLDGDPSLFLYAVLSVPIGGPPCFFVEGLAAGFGVNRALHVPPIDKVKDFPLVREAMEGRHDIGDAANRAALLQEKIASLSTYIKPEVGQGFLAVGLKFSSFKLVNAFALVTMSLGERFELHLLGLARLTIPFGDLGVDPIAQMELALKASILPDEGVVSVEAQLTPDSFILSRTCRLTGGFALYFWFAGPHAGDFVISVGGYHPRFPVPEHYPVVPRLGFNWNLGPATIKGEGYLALCASAVMAGGALSVDFKAGSAYAYFRANADFLVSWRPYHYDIELGVSIGAGLGFLGPINVSARLRLWGPDFGGFAAIDVWLFSFNVEFGDQSNRYPKAIGWTDFRDGFLPPADEVCSVTVNSGLLHQVQEDDAYWVVNPKEFSLSTDAFVPTKAAFQGPGKTPLDVGGARGAFGIRPMGAMPDTVHAEQHIRITRETGSGSTNVEQMFRFTPVRKEMPAAIWGRASTPKNHPDRVLPPAADEPLFVQGGVVTGFDITVAKQPPPSDTEDIESKKLQHDTTEVPGLFRWSSRAPFHSSGDDAARRARIRRSVGSNAVRNGILGALGFDPERAVVIDPASLVEAFVIAPEVQS